ncbi:MAG TPA: hypothetical protein VFA20_24090 [Myxococcaceae bacterium]|nr:hypothetical protein [Myxococcaceae bacterium]
MPVPWMVVGLFLSAGASKPADCPADASWLKSTTPPAEVPGGGASLCNFQQFAWADFLALNQPLQGPGPLQYETWMTKEGLFQPSVYDANRSTPFPWGAQMPVPPQCKSVAAAVKGKPVRVMRLVKKGGFADEIQQAGSNTAPLVDQSGNWVHFEQRLNQTQYDYITGCGLYATSCFDTLGSDTGNGSSDPTTIEFPAQSIEIKTSWKVLDRGDADVRSRYYTVEAFVQPASATNPGCEAQLLGLVGFHIVHKTPDHPESVWETFEHEDDAPDCFSAAAKAPSGKPWSFYNPSCSGTACPTNLFRNACNANGACPKGAETTFACGKDLNQTCQTVGTCPSTSPPQPASAYCSYCWDPTCASAAIPTQACRDFPIGFGGKGFVDSSIEALNKSVHALLPPGSVWRHYKLVGTEWFGPPKPEKVTITYGSNGKATNPLEGSVNLSNVTMETYNQGLSGGCFACHNGSFGKSSDPFPQADFSHLFAGMTIRGSGACKSPPGMKCPATFSPGAARKR